MSSTPCTAWLAWKSGGVVMSSRPLRCKPDLLNFLRVLNLFLPTLMFSPFYNSCIRPVRVSLISSTVFIRNHSTGEFVFVSPALRFEPGTAGWDAPRLPLCHSACPRLHWYSTIVVCHLYSALVDRQQVTSTPSLSYSTNQVTSWRPFQTNTSCVSCKAHFHFLASSRK